jgi:hypothetical protein
MGELIDDSSLPRPEKSRRELAAELRKIFLNRVQCMRLNSTGHNIFPSLNRLTLWAKLTVVTNTGTISPQSI